MFYSRCQLFAGRKRGIEKFKRRLYVRKHKLKINDTVLDLENDKIVVITKSGYKEPEFFES